jgi:hypothetical protein
VLGITSILFCWWGILSLAQIVLAIVFSSVGIHNANHHGADKKGMAITGLMCGIAGFAAYVSIGIASAGVGFFI